MLGIFPAPCAGRSIPDEVFDQVSARWPSGDLDTERIVFVKKANVPTPVEELAQALDEPLGEQQFSVLRGPNGRRMPLLMPSGSDSNKIRGWLICLDKEYGQHTWRKCHTKDFWCWYSDPDINPIWTPK